MATLIRRVRRWLAVREIHLIMELCPGESLQSRRPGSVLETLRIFGEVAEALAYMNDRGYVHADTKPNNIIAGPNGTVKVIDLGQSCPLGTVKQRIQGTRDFIAPEQVHRRPLNARTDVFNFGAALYWTLTGRGIPTALPRRGRAALEAEQIVVPPQHINPDVPEPLAELVSDCIEALPADRPATMSGVASRLSEITGSLAGSGPGTGGT